MARIGVYNFWEVEVVCLSPFLLFHSWLVNVMAGPHKGIFFPYVISWESHRQKEFFSHTEINGVSG